MIFGALFGFFLLAFEIEDPIWDSPTKFRVDFMVMFSSLLHIIPSIVLFGYELDMVIEISSSKLCFIITYVVLYHIFAIGSCLLLIFYVVVSNAIFLYVYPAFFLVAFIFFGLAIHNMNRINPEIVAIARRPLGIPNEVASATLRGPEDEANTIAGDNNYNSF